MQSTWNPHEITHYFIKLIWPVFYSTEFHLLGIGGGSRPHQISVVYQVINCFFIIKVGVRIPC